jgi:DNA invertase Pin-like site-specific DNA recombinase
VAHPDGFRENVMLVGYARVSTREQNQALQLDALEAAGCGRVYTVSGV